MVKKRGLGKSLDALLAYTGSSEPKEETQAPKAADVAPQQTTTQEPNNVAEINTQPPANKDGGVRQMDVTQIKRGKYQPRREMDTEALEDLANSIKTQGIIQPLIVRPVGDKHEIIAGERRWRAAQMAGLDAVPVIVRDIPDEAAIAIALIENIQRENLNPIEEAIALKRLIDEFGMTHQQAADAVGKSRATISNLLRLLALPDDVKNMMEKGQLEMGHARTLITLPESMQLEAANMIIARDLSVRETEALVKQLQAKQEPTPPPRPVDPDILRIEDKIASRLNMKVALKCNAKGRGKLVIHYRNLRELDDLLEHLEVEGVTS